MINGILTSLLSVAGVVFAFGLVIFVHEFGHFFVAKKSGVKVEQFSFGFGKEIFGFTKGETRYTVNWIPLGGFVKMAGDTPEGYEGPVLEKTQNAPTSAETEREFFAQAWYKRVAIALAGPVMNYGLAFVIFSSMFLFWGEPFQVNKTQIGEVMQGKPADVAGLKKGDYVVSVQGEPMEDFQAVALKIRARAEQPTDLVIKRDGQEMKITVTPEKEKSAGYGLIGIRPADPVQDHRPIAFTAAVDRAAWQCWTISAYTVLYLVERIRTHQRPDVAGPLGITQVIVKAVRTGAEEFLFLIGMISVAIGLFNLFPVPLLDGGHVLYYVIEGIIGRPVSQKVMSRANMVGFALLMSLFLFATFNDIQRLQNSRRDSKKVAMPVAAPSPVPSQP